MVKVETLP